MRNRQRKTIRGGSAPHPFESLRPVLPQGDHWSRYLSELWSGQGPGYSVHLAIFVQPYLEYLLSGRKTVESRFSVVRCAPYRRVRQGDVVLVKASGGPIVGICRVGQVWFYQLDPDSWRTIRTYFTESLSAQDPEFWRARSNASFATLLQVEDVRRISPVPWVKRDRRGWVVLHPGTASTLWEGHMKSSVIAFSGGIASGKTTLSEIVARTLGCNRVSFGSHVRTIARARGLAETRENLQSVGELLAGGDLKQFCSDVLAQAPWKPGSTLVVDGVRHVEVVKELKALVSPSALRLIHVDVDASSRERRLQERVPGELPLELLERHSTEIQVRTELRQLADLVVDGTRSADAVASEISTWVTALS